MSSSTAEPLPEVVGKPAKEKKGFGKVFSNLSRMRTILKKPGDASSKRQSAARNIKTPSNEAEATTSAAAAPSAPARKSPQYEGATRIPRTQIHEERARKLGASFGLEIKPSEWHSAEGDVLRVEKPVRVRIHRECHKCHASFGTGNQCPSCRHNRCTQCIRTPPKRTESEKRADRARREELALRQRELAPIIPHYGLSKPIVVTRPSRTGGQPMVHKPLRMRVRRNCHKCSTLFTSGTRICEACGHKRCDDCSKAPDKRKKYPYGYPGDEPGENSPSYHQCHECNKKFPPNTEDGVECASCSHEKCPTCPRVPRIRVEEDPDPEILRGISDRLQVLNLS